MQNLIKDGRVHSDEWVLVRDASGALPAGELILPLPRWHERSSSGQSAVWLAAETELAELTPELLALPLLAIDFPTFTDGRGYSLARSLRERYGFSGELRAIGDIQRDQLYFLHQVGFDSFALRHDLAAEQALAGLLDFSAAYQVSWRRRQPGFRSSRLVC